MGEGQYDPWVHAARLGLRVITRELPGFYGYWHAPSRTIVLDQGLSQREQRCTLAHEIVHVEEGDCCQQTETVERTVHEAAARRLIHIEQLAEAACWAESRDELAHELFVDDETLAVRLSTLNDVERGVIDERGSRREGAA